jgi:CubicO group peptidase (beta-lactamase class C family)
VAESLVLSAAARDQLSRWFDGKDIVSPSINYAVFDRTGVIFHHGIGEFQRDGRPPELDTIYRICSLSKSFCAAAILVLRDRGQLSLSDPVSKYIPEFQTYRDSQGCEIPVSLGMLMSNSSGLPEDNAWADYHLGMTRGDLLETLRTGLNFSDYPDAGFQYSNIGFAVLGLIAEDVSGKPFKSFATETFLGPLALTGTRFDAADYPNNGEGGAGIAYGFDSFDEGETWIHRPFAKTGAFACAGSMYSTLPDIARWSGWLSSGFVPNNSDDAILSRASRRLMQRSFTPHHLVDRALRPELDNVGYGLGLVVEHDKRFGVCVQHPGGLPGFSTNMRWHCSSGIGVAIFANTSGLSPAVWSAEILRLVLTELDVPAKVVPLWPATLAAARAVEGVVCGSGDFTDIQALYSHNLLSDVPADVRGSRVADAINEVGGLVPILDIPPLTSRLAWAASAAHLCWTIPGNCGDLYCSMELTEVEPSTIQRLEITAGKDVGHCPSLITRHYRPIAPLS